jgi:hypothetical protein
MAPLEKVNKILKKFTNCPRIAIPLGPTKIATTLFDIKPVAILINVIILENKVVLISFN